MENVSVNQAGQVPPVLTVSDTLNLLTWVYWQHDRVVRYISNVRTDRQMLTDMYFEKGAFFVYENAYFNV
jgi:CMP-N-acetylneuraminic acid synthetase